MLDRLLWIGAAAVTGMIGAFYALLGLNVWLRSRAVLGLVSPEARQTLGSLLEISRQGNSLKWARLMLMYAALGALVGALAAGEWLGLVIAAAPFALIWWIRIRTTTAPVVLLLGTSTHSSIRRQREMKRRLSPLRVVSLLDVDVPWDPGLTREMALDCFRTSNEDDWWRVITHLMDITPVIALDTGAETPGVFREARHILGTGIARKCLFLTPPDGSSPILDRLPQTLRPEREDLRVASYEEGPRLIAAMVAELARRRASLPRPY